MQIQRGYRTELKLTPAQVTACKKHAGAARYAWNWGLRRKQEVYKETGHSISAMELHRELNALKQTELSWMYEVSKCAPQEALRDLDKAYQHYFRRCRDKKAGKFKGKAGHPRFKSKKHGLGSFRLTGSIHVYEDAVDLPRLGRLRLYEHGYIPTRGVHILSATVSEQAGRWYVFIQVREDLPDPVPATGNPIGIDLGINTLATCSDGMIIANPKVLRASLTRLKRLQRRLSRKKKGGKNREKARKRFARHHAHVAHLRRDALHKATSAIVAKTKPSGQRPRVIVLEDLSVAGMMKNHRLAQAIGDVGMAEFRRQMEYKTAWRGQPLLTADRWYPSTKRCSGCGNVKADMDLSERIYICEKDGCGLVIDRDFNAALNLAALAR